MRRGAERRKRIPAKQRILAWMRGIIRAMERAVRTPKPASGRK